ncbi:MAG: hypothetical protein ACRDLN_13955 [Solirubrobacteraceae bacterium]
MPARVSRLLPAEPARPISLHDSWWAFAAVAFAVYAVLAVGIWMSAHLHPDRTLHNVALFAHLASLVVGFGAVLVADYFVLLWLLRRCTFAEAIHSAARLHVPIWIGLTGLVFSGFLLQPDLSAGTTRAKLAFVAILTLNGLHAMVLSTRVEAAAGVLSMRLLTWGAATTTVSQACWWGSVVIGFLTANKL